MKKFFSLIALAGVLAACTPEQIQTAFKLDGAKGVIAVEVVKLDGAPISGQFQIAGYQSLPNSSITYEGNKALIAFYAAESTAISEQVLTLTATGEQIITPVSTTVTVPDLIAGQVVTLSGLIRVGENADGWYVDVVETKGEPSQSEGFLANDSYSTYAYSHAGISSWYVNNSENYLTGSVQIPVEVGSEPCTNFTSTDYAGFENAIAQFKSSSEAGTLTSEVVNYDFVVSAWAMWNVYVQRSVCPVHAKLQATRLGADGERTDEVVTLAECDYVLHLETTYRAVELPYPEAAGHYVEGHGHANGGNNAGGGISFNE